jgi:predicted ester cyclase
MFNDKNWDAFQNCYTEQATSEDVGSSNPVRRGRADIIAFDKSRLTPFPDQRGDVRLILANGSHLASVVIWTATNHGDMPGPDGKMMTATHKKIGQYLAHTIELDGTGTKGVADAVYSDDSTTMAQLGLSKAPARPVLTPVGTPATIVIAKNDETERANTAAFRSLLDTVNKHDLKAFDDMLPADYKAIDITEAKDQDKAGALVAMKGFIAAFPDMALSADTVWAAGDYVVATGHFTGTNKGAMPAMGMPKPTNKPVDVRFVEIFKFEGGKVKEDWTFYNNASFATQLGLK